MKWTVPFLLLFTSLSQAVPEKALFGSYTRSQNKNPQAYETRIVGQIAGHCSGTLIGPRHVLTAAHCAFDLNTSRKQKDLSFNPGKINSDGISYKVVDWKQVYLPKRFNLDSGDFQDDFAVIELKENIGDTLGWAGFKVLGEVKEFKVSLTGYPLDKEEGTQWRVKCPAQVRAQEIRYLCDTFGGMSGSAVFEDNGSFIYGIHVFGDKPFNGAVKITNERYQLIKSWVDGKPNKDTVIFKNR